LAGSGVTGVMNTVSVKAVSTFTVPDQSEMLSTKSSADNAASYASSAYTAASNASSYASGALTAANYIRNTMLSTAGGIVQDGSGTVLAAARSANTSAGNAYNSAHSANIKLDLLQNAITNIQNNLGVDTSPPVVTIRTLSGAAATSSNSIQAVLDVSDNVSSAFLYSLNNISYTVLPENRTITLPVSSAGPNLIAVWVKDQAGNVGTTSITIRKL